MKYFLIILLHLELESTFYKIVAKLYFLIPMYSILLSVGSIKLEEKFSNSIKTKIAIPIVYILLSLPLLPMLVPLLPLNYFISYAKVLGVDAGIKYENNRLNQLPQHFADRFGWEELVRDISIEYHDIPNGNEQNAGILTNNWGIASAVHFYKDKYKLPEPTSNDGWYYFEAIRNNNFRNIYICVGFDERSLSRAFNTVIKKRIFIHPYCMPYENNRPIYFCADPKVDIAQYFKVRRRIDPEFLSILRKEGPENAIAFYKKLKSINDKTILFTEYQINYLGYEYLWKNLLDEAIIIFKFNVEEFPESSNVYDSLGEAYMVKSNTELAILNYEKSLELNPKNENAKKMLEKLRAK